jgi:hemoglobin
MALTIYERNGGFPAIRRMIADFYEEALDSPVIGHHFEDIDMPRLMDHQTRFVSFLMGGPSASYSDEHIARVHAKRGITHDEFDEMVALLSEAMTDHDFPKDDIAAVRAELSRRESLIVTA